VFGFGGDCRPSCERDRLHWRVRWLTFELRGRNRRGAWPARRMMDHNGARAKCHAGGGPWLERRVRPHRYFASLHGVASDLVSKLAASKSASIGGMLG
jgi:hypothetical protein